MPADLGLTTWKWVSPLTDDNLPDVARRISRAGYDRAELPFETLDGFDPAEARAVLAGFGLGSTTVGAITADRDLLSEDAGVRENGERFLRGAIDAAAELGSPTMSGRSTLRLVAAGCRLRQSGLRISSAWSPRSRQSPHTLLSVESGLVSNH